MGKAPGLTRRESKLLILALLDHLFYHRNTAPFTATGVLVTCWLLLAVAASGGTVCSTAPDGPGQRREAVRIGQHLWIAAG